MSKSVVYEIDDMHVLLTDFAAPLALTYYTYIAEINVST